MTQAIRPFLKWAGGKFRLVDRIAAGLPEARCLIEPFVGAGAVFLNTNYPRYRLADCNPDLINLYQSLQTGGASFVDDAKDFFTLKNNHEKVYYRYRKQFNQSDDPYERALLFLYLNRHCYNGLCRYNRSGGFNVPFGRYKRPYFPSDELYSFHEKSQRAVFVCEDFSTIMRQARRGSVVYCDPPYVPLSASASFTNYAQHGFGLGEQQQLADLARQLADRGIPVLLSNHDTQFTRQAYREAQISRFKVSRFISCNTNKRKPVHEVLALFS